MNISALESRITCLENKLIGKSITKNESMDSRLRRELSNIFNSFCNDYFDSDRELVSNMQRLASYSNDSMVDDTIIWLSDNTSRDTDELENYRGEIEDYLAEWASDFMQDMRQEECNNEWCDESCHRRNAKNECAQTYSPEELADFCLRNYNLKGQITNTLHFAPGPDDIGYEECVELTKALEDLREAAHKVIFEAKKIKNW